MCRSLAGAIVCEDKKLLVQRFIVKKSFLNLLTTHLKEFLEYVLSMEVGVTKSISIFSLVWKGQSLDQEHHFVAPDSLKVSRYRGKRRRVRSGEEFLETKGCWRLPMPLVSLLHAYKLVAAPGFLVRSGAALLISHQVGRSLTDFAVTKNIEWKISSYLFIRSWIPI